VAIDKDKNSIRDREYFKFIESPTRPGFPVPEVSDTALTEAVSSGIKKADVLAMTRSSGLQEGETYDQIEGAQVTSDEYVLQYDLNGICQFQIQMDTSDDSSFEIIKRVCEFDMLQEDGFVLLQEDGFALRTEGLVP
jgi:hypothetical protein